ncbi:MAG: hypothetical protein LUD46_11655 [Parabacteroides sp.]|nr:hypothetical protein [Parabacteroides sp.]
MVDAVMMVSFIILVLVSTTDFESETVKNATMGSLGLLTVLMVTLRIIQTRKEAKEPKKEYEY